MKIRICIFKPDHTNDIFFLNPKKDKVDATHFKRNEMMYETDGKHFQITTDRVWWTLWLYKRYHTTYYYVQGVSRPLNVPDFDGEYATEGNVPSDELARIFDPWFLRTISQPARDLVDNLHFFVSIGTFLAVIYLIWKVHTGTTDGTEVQPSSDGGIEFGP